ncbi:MAG TPA: hypothetical protein VGK89_09195 [Candidatus Eisenbacteria bacterium]
MAVPPAREEHVTGGQLDLVWQNGFMVSANMKPLTLLPSDPGYANPSGDHTVACATNMPPDSGGIILTTTDPAGLSDYEWEAWIFTGDGNTRRGLVVRADPTNGFTSSYQFVIQSGLFQLNFRKLINQSPTTLGTWFANTLPGGVPAVNTWHKMKVIAIGGMFRCFWDGFELTTSPIIDNDLATGWVGVYNFRFDLGGVPFLTDDLILTPAGETPTAKTSWGALKLRYTH